MQDFMFYICNFSARETILNSMFSWLGVAHAGPPKLRFAHTHGTHTHTAIPTLANRMEESHKVLFNGIFLPLLTVIMLMRSLRVFVRIFYLCILNCVRPRLVSHSSPAYTAKKKKQMYENTPHTWHSHKTRTS